MEHRRDSSSSRPLAPWAWLLAVVAALFGAGCGGAAYEGKASQSPGTPYLTASDTDYDRIADSDDGMEEHAPAETAATGGSPPPVQRSAYKAKDEPPQDAQPSGTAGATAAAPPAAEGTVATPLLIYEASLTVAVYKAADAIDKVETLARDVGGYLVRRDDNSITVRVPAAKFHGSLETLAKIGDVLHRNVSVRDVTDEFLDVETRLKNAEAMRRRLEELLSKAQNVSDALAVERELGRVAGEIERMKGRLKLLRELVSFSTITLRFQAQQTEHIGSTVRLPFPWLDQLGLADLLRL
jgi:hypothetical protein